MVFITRKSQEVNHVTEKMNQIIFMDEDSGFHDEVESQPVPKKIRLSSDLDETLPTLPNETYSDIQKISNKTLVSLLNGIYDTKYLILDARYPYEYDGGHIKGAVNVTSKNIINEILFSTAALNSRPKFIIVHCEFSIQRGPKLIREIREHDRCINKDNYPNLFYPNLYLLDGGYKSFFDSFKKFCYPQCYTPMLHDEHRSEMKNFRKKSKSWNCPTSSSAAQKSPSTRLSRASTKIKLDF